MRVLGVGSRFSILALVAMLGGQAACSAREADESSEGTAVYSEGVNSEGVSSDRAGVEPQQVVQRMVAKATSGENSAPVPSAAGSGVPRDGVAGEARASAAGVSRASAGSLAPRTNSAEMITPRHLEAELNRLEAELAN